LGEARKKKSKTGIQNDLGWDEKARRASFTPKKKKVIKFLSWGGLSGGSRREGEEQIGWSGGS